MSDNIFVDTNIWLYALMNNNDKKQKKATAIVKKSNIIVSTQVINEICYNLKIKTDYKEDEISQLIENIFNQYTVVIFSKDILTSASKIRTKYSISFWDSLIIAAAINNVTTFMINDYTSSRFELRASSVEYIYNNGIGGNAPIGSLR